MNKLTKKQMLMTTLLSAATIGAFAAPAQAQSSDDEIVVTGSRIKKKDFISNSPVSTVDSLQFERTFSINTENLLNSLPQTTPGFGATSNNPGDGSATVDLRGLGTNRTLVLVNGTRQVPFGQGGVVDLNTIPASLIDSVEVLTGGASAVYGADAVAGVVNFILKDDFEGVETNVGYSISEEGDSELFNIDATFGANFADGRGNATINVGYVDRQSTLQGERDFSQTALFNAGDAGSGDLEPGGSSGVPGTSIFIGAPGFDFADGQNSTLGLFEGQGGFRPFVASGDVNDFYNYAPVNFLQLPQERFTVTGLANYEINNAVEVYTRTTFSQNRVDSQLAPTPIFQNSEFSIDGSPFLSAATQQTLSDAIGSGVDTDGDGIDDTSDGSLVRRRLTEVGPRQTVDINDAFQITIGARGDITDTWSYDVFLQEGRTTRAQTQNGNVNRGRFDQALILADADGDGNVDVDANGNATCADTSSNGGVVDCAPLNIFGAGNISQAAADFINTTAAATSEFEQTVIQANVSGNLGSFSLTSEPIGVAFGAEYIETEADFRPSQDIAASTIAGFNGSPPSGGSDDVYSIYGEASIPLVADFPFAQRITLDISGRYSDYDNSGGTEAYKIGGEWAVTDEFRLRGNYNRAVRAPNIGELFQPIAQGFPGAIDPCSAAGNPTAAVTAICVATGVPLAAVGTVGINTVSGQVQTLGGGNPDLDVEEADTFTIGAVIEPSFVPGLSLSVDYYDITINDSIAAFGGGANNVLETCYTDTVNGGANSAFCGVINRFADGSIDFISLQQQNVAETSTSGIDLIATYPFELPGNLGGMNLSYNGNLNLESDFIAFEGADVITCDGEFGNTCGEPRPKYGHRVTSNWSRDNWSVQGTWQLIGKTTDDTPGANSVEDIGTEHYFNLSSTVDFGENVSITFGSNNLLDNGPPLLGQNAAQANTFPSTFDVFGRTYFANLKTRF